MRLSADALAGPPELGRSVLVRPGGAAPDAWSGCERVRVSLHDASGAIGRRLREAWLGRIRLVIELEGEFPEPSPVWQAPWWELAPGLTMRSEVLAHLITANAVDARDPQRPRFVPAEAALKLGAVPAGRPGTGEDRAGDVLTDAGPVWCDGGPLETFDLAAPVVPAANLAVGSLRGVKPATPRADLAPDQQAAVGHLGGAASIVAPAGSGKTRVLTERARYLVRDLGLAAEAVCLVAFNVRARREMQERTADIAGLQVRTLNSLALAICNGSGPFRRPARHGRVDVADEMAVRQRLDDMTKRPRRAMTDQLAPWLEALSATRLGLRDPAEVERDFQPDVPDFATVAPQFVEELGADGFVDFDQQIVRAIEILLADPAARATARRICGVLLVDEFQDLTPAHLLLVRLLAGPRADVFGVGDDDQTIYGYSGATPQWLIDYRNYFPGAARHLLEVNYRCPAFVVDAAVKLLSHNRQRVDKQIVAKASAEGSGALEVHAGGDAAEALRGTVGSLIERGARPADIAVLTRVNSTLLVPQIVLGDMGVPADAPVGRRFLERTGVAGALAWLRLAVAPARALPSGALMDAARRPPRGISPRVIEWIGEQRSVSALRALAGRVKDERTARKIEEFTDDVEMLCARTVEEDLTTEQVLESVRDDLGLGGSLDNRLDASRRSVDRSAHGDDLAALISVAHLHPDPAGFAGWLGERLGAASSHEWDGFRADAQPAADGYAEPNPRTAGGVRLATIHKVKGLEWPHVVVYEASAGLMPHRLSHDVEEERRVFHVALTRCSESVAFVCGDPPSSFMSELREFAPPPPPEPEMTPVAPSRRGSRTPATAAPSPASPRNQAGTGRERRSGAGAQGGASDSAVSRPEPPTDPQGAALYEALREWRRERSNADGVPAFVVCHDKTLIEIANRRPTVREELLLVPGIGPAKLDKYGDDIAAVLARH